MSLAMNAMSIGPFLTYNGFLLAEGWQAACINAGVRGQLTSEFSAAGHSLEHFAGAHAASETLCLG